MLIPSLCWVPHPSTQKEKLQCWPVQKSNHTTKNINNAKEEASSLNPVSLGSSMFIHFVRKQLLFQGFAFGLLHGHVLWLLGIWNEKGPAPWGSLKKSGKCAKPKNKHFVYISYIIYWLVVWNMAFIFPFSWEFHHPNWRTHIFQRGRLNHQPVLYIYI